MNDAALAPATRSARSSARGSRGGDLRVDHQPGFVLHATPWRETSLIIEVLTRDFGRLALVARGAKRPTSQFRGVLAPFAPVALAWSGRNDIKTLIRAEWVGGLTPLRGDGLLAAFYMNELLVRLLARGDPHDALFGAYAHALHALAGGEGALDEALRGFELDLLREIGWLPPLAHTCDGAPIAAAASYRVDPERGPMPVNGRAEDGETLVVRGAALQALASRDWSDAGVATECRRLLRALIAFRLGGRPLNTRRILADLKKL